MPLSRDLLHESNIAAEGKDKGEVGQEDFVPELRERRGGISRRKRRTRRYNNEGKETECTYF